MMLSVLLTPVTFDFMQNALIISAVIAIPTALLSCFLVLKGWALMGDAISHAIFPGIVLAYVAGIPFAVGAVLAGMSCAVSIGYLHSNSRIRQDTVMGIVFSGMFALGLLLYTWIRSDVHLDHILFGDMLGVLRHDVIDSAVIGVLITGWIMMKWRALLIFIFDPMQARAVGIPVRGANYALLIAVSLSVVMTLKAVGLVLAIALLIAPGAIAFLLTKRFKMMLLIAVSIALSMALLGVYVSFFIDSAPAPTIVLLLTAVFLVALIGTTYKQYRQRQIANLAEC